MDSDRIVGKGKDLAGQAESVAGDFLGDRETQVRGKIRQAAGVAQEAYGEAKDTLQENFADVSASAERAFGSIEREVKARPLTALLIAALVGFVVAQLTTR